MSERVGSEGVIMEVGVLHVAEAVQEVAGLRVAEMQGGQISVQVAVPPAPHGATACLGCCPRLHEGGSCPAGRC